MESREADQSDGPLVSLKVPIVLDAVDGCMDGPWMVEGCAPIPRGIPMLCLIHGDPW